MSEITKQHTKLKNELRAIQRDFSNWLDKTKNKTGPELRGQADFYNRTKEAAAKKLDAFEKKNNLGSYGTKKAVRRTVSKKGGGGGRAGAATENIKGNSLIQRLNS